MSLDLAPDASEESGYATLHLKPSLFCAVASSCSFPSTVINHLHPLFSNFLQVKLSLKSVDHPEVGGQTWSA